jgi:hypothetical protein
MATREIDKLIWTALTDLDFCAQLLNGKRHEVLASVNLTEVEQQQAALAVEANTLAAFASAFCIPEAYKTLMP